MADILRGAVVVNRREPAPVFGIRLDVPINLAIGLVAALPIGAAALTSAPDFRPLRYTPDTSADTPLTLLTAGQAPVITAPGAAPARPVWLASDTSSGSPLALLSQVAADPVQGFTWNSAPQLTRQLQNTTRGSPKTLIADAQMPVGAQHTAPIPRAQAPRNWLPVSTAASMPAVNLIPILAPPVGTVAPSFRVYPRPPVTNTTTGTAPWVLDNPAITLKYARAEVYMPRAVPRDPALLPAYIQQELANIARAVSSAVPYVILTPLAVAPEKKYEGMEVEADGTNWNPGSGKGRYVLRNGAWVFLG